MTEQGQKLTDRDHAIIDRVETSLADGLEVYRWWLGANEQFIESEGTAGLTHTFPMMDAHSRPNVNFGFMEQMTLRDAPYNVVGTLQDEMYSQPKHARRDGDDRRHQLETFMMKQAQTYMLRYFMRVAAAQNPTLVGSKPDEPLDIPSWLEPLLRPLLWYKGGQSQRSGWQYRQLYWKDAKTGDVRKFAKEDQKMIVDVRDLGEKCAWVVMRVRIFNFSVSVPPFPDGAHVVLPWTQPAYVVMSPEFIVNEPVKPSKRPAPLPTFRGQTFDLDRLGSYGWGYALINVDTPDGVLAYGPANLGPGFMHFTMNVHRGGEVWLRNTFTARRPTEMFRLPLNPLDWGVRLSNLATFDLSAPFLNPIASVMRRLPGGRASFDPLFSFIHLANAATQGQAAKSLCISEDQFIKELMALHYLDCHEFARVTRANWELVPDWNDPSQIPEWLS